MLVNASFLLLSAAAATTAAPTCATRDDRVERLIATNAKESGGQEYCQFRLYETLSDVDGDRREDFLVVFEIEGEGGGNNSVQYLAVFPSGTAWTPAVTEVGRRGQRAVKALRVESGVIVLDTLDQGPDDAMCCPSIKGEATLRFTKGTLLPVAPARPPAK